MRMDMPCWWAPIRAKQLSIAATVRVIWPKLGVCVPLALSLSYQLKKLKRFHFLITPQDLSTELTDTWTLEKSRNFVYQIVCLWVTCESAVLFTFFFRWSLISIASIVFSQTDCRLRMEIWSKMLDFELIPHDKGLIQFLCILLSFV